MKTKFILILVTVFVAITGCQSGQIEAPALQSSDEYKKLVVTDMNYDKSTKTISYKIENKSNEIITTGLAYTIEKYKNKNWNKTDLTDNLLFAEIALLLNPNKTIEEKIDLSQINKLKDGYYRIKKEYFREEDTINQYIEFKVEDENISNFSNYNTIKK